MMHDHPMGHSLTPWARPLIPAARWPRVMALLLSLGAVAGTVLWPAQHLPPTLGVRGTCPLSAIATVAQVERRLAADPVGCSGRIVQVRGRAARWVSWQAPDRLVAQVALIDAVPGPGSVPLMLTWGRPDPLLATLRRLPLLRGLVPPPQQLHEGTSAETRGSARTSGKVCE